MHPSYKALASGLAWHTLWSEAEVSVMFANKAAGHFAQWALIYHC